MTDTPEDVRQIAFDAAKIYAGAHHASRSLTGTIIAAIMADRENRGEPVAWQPKYKQDVIDHHRSNGDDFWEYAMTIFKTKEGAETYGLGAHEVRPLFSAPHTPEPVDVDAVIERCAMVVESGQIKDSNAGQTVEPRMEGNRAGLAYAAAIRALKGEAQ